MKIVVEEQGARSVVRLADNAVGVGRALDNEIRLASAKVSRHHCRIERDGDGWVVVDLGSANGLVVNGTRTRRSRLVAGDELVLGGARLSLVPDEGEGAFASRDEIGLRTALGEPSEAEERLARLTELVRATGSGRNSLEVQRELLDAGLELLGAERGFLLQAGPPNEPPRVVLARLFDGSDVPVPSLRVSQGIAQLVLRKGEPILSVDARRDERFGEMSSVEDLRLRSVLCVPISAPDGDGPPRGALLFDNRMQSSHFDALGLRLAGLLAELVGLVLVEADRRERVAGRDAEVAALRSQVTALEEELGRAPGPDGRPEATAPRRFPGLVGRAPAMLKLYEQLERVIACELPVLIHGESGTGKELIARAVHNLGPRAKQPFVSENCAALPDSLLESELFGHVRGAFTGADRAKKGLCELASGGTLFLDEIGDMSAEMQKKLLRVLQEGVVRPVGGDQNIEVDLRLVAASHRNLVDLVQRGLFREDLYYRVNVLELTVPPLRERREDVPLLARELLARAARETGRPRPLLSHDVLEVLCLYDWPGNVRELENEMRRMVVLAGDRVRVEQLSQAIRERHPGPKEQAAVDTAAFETAAAAAATVAAVDGDLRGAVAEFERRAIVDALERHAGNKSRAAVELGITRFALQRKLEKYGLVAPGDTDGEPATGDESADGADA
ncbi:MAG: FHA domain-containing protein [Planctomycetaceae bacterium]|nr:FHA domain-containing protein [Planctomycetaceae bacterium]